MDSKKSLQSKVREYFSLCDVREEKTPCLLNAPTAEPNIKSFKVAHGNSDLFLRTSPESALKQIVCKDAVDIFELGPVFRDENLDKYHLAEFTMVEWYRVGMSYEDLMGDVLRLLSHIGLSKQNSAIPYGELFKSTFGFCCHTASIAQLEACALRVGLIASDVDLKDRTHLIDFLTTYLVTEKISGKGLVFLYDYPIELRCYAELSLGTPRFAKRFELFADGLELANGYQEILSEEEQRTCFVAENERRRAKGLDQVSIDESWLRSLRHTALNSLSGVALGLERVLMKITGMKDIRYL